MKTIKLFSLTIFMLVIILSCQKQDATDPEIRENALEGKSQTMTNSNRTIAFFVANLKNDMKYEQIVNTFGEPDGDLGSGFHIYYYNLTDGTQLRIVYAYDKIQAAVQVDPKEKDPEKVILTLI